MEVLGRRVFLMSEVPLQGSLPPCSALRSRLAFSFRIFDSDETSDTPRPGASVSSALTEASTLITFTV